MASSTSGGGSTNRVGKYSLHDTLGEGAFGKVKLGIDTSTGSEYAIKIMEKTHIEEHGLTLQVRREIAVMKAMRHPNIVNLYEVLNSSKKLYMVMDLVTGGELFDAVAAEGRLGEAVARSYFQQLVDGIRYCHSRRVYHRDLKPENLLLSGDKKVLKITDFGLASIKAANAKSELLHTVMGSPHYIAPEVITSAKEGYDGEKVDIWSCGIILFGMLAGALPFDEDGTRALYKAIVHNPVVYPKHFSYDVIKLLRAMLHKDPAKRASMDEILTFNWFKVDYEPAILMPDPEPEEPKKHRMKPSAGSSSSLSSTNPNGEREGTERRKRPKGSGRKKRGGSSSNLNAAGESTSTLGSANSSTSLGSSATVETSNTNGKGRTSSSALKAADPGNGNLPVRANSKSCTEVECATSSSTGVTGHSRVSSQAQAKKPEQTDPRSIATQKAPSFSSTVHHTISTDRSHTTTRTTAQTTSTSILGERQTQSSVTAAATPASSFTSGPSTNAQNFGRHNRRPGISLKDMRARLNVRQTQGNSSISGGKTPLSSGRKSSNLSRGASLQKAGSRGQVKEWNEEMNSSTTSTSPRVELSDVVPIFSPPSSRSQTSLFKASSPRASSKPKDSDLRNSPPYVLRAGENGDDHSLHLTQLDSLGPMTPRSNRRLELPPSNFLDRIGSSTQPSSISSPKVLDDSTSFGHTKQMERSASGGASTFSKRQFIRSASQPLGEKIGGTSHVRGFEERDRHHGQSLARCGRSLGREASTDSSGKPLDIKERGSGSSRDSAESSHAMPPPLMRSSSSSLRDNPGLKASASAEDLSENLPRFGSHLSNSSSGSLAQPRPMSGLSGKDSSVAAAQLSRSVKFPLDRDTSRDSRDDSQSSHPNSFLQRFKVLQSKPSHPDNRFAITPMHSEDMNSRDRPPPMTEPENFAFDRKILGNRLLSRLGADHSQESDQQQQSSQTREGMAPPETATKEPLPNNETGAASLPKVVEVGENPEDATCSLTSPVTPEEEVSTVFTESPKPAQNQKQSSGNVSFIRKSGPQKSKKKMSGNLTSVLFKNAGNLVADSVDREPSVNRSVSSAAVEGVGIVDEPLETRAVNENPDEKGTTEKKRTAAGSEAGSPKGVEDVGERGEKAAQQQRDDSIEYQQVELQEEQEEEYYNEEEEYDYETFDNGAGGTWAAGVPQSVLTELYKQDHDHGYPPWYALDIDVFEDPAEGAKDEGMCRSRDAQDISAGDGSVEDGFVERMSTMLRKTPGPPIAVTIRKDEVRESHSGDLDQSVSAGAGKSTVPRRRILGCSDSFIAIKKANPNTAAERKQSSTAR